MALDTYTNLQASVANWLDRADLAAVVPDFISMAEAQIGRRLLKDGPVRNMMKRQVITIASEFTDLPDDFLGVRSLYVNGSNSRTLQLAFCEPEQITQRKSQTTQLTGNPHEFAIVGTELQVFKAPTSSLSGELVYWGKIPALSADAPSNWLLTRHPDAYLYGALLQSAPYLRDDPRLSMWGQIFETILSDIVEADKMERHAPVMAIPMPGNGTP